MKFEINATPTTVTIKLKHKDNEFIQSASYDEKGGVVIDGSEIWEQAEATGEYTEKMLDEIYSAVEMFSPIDYFMQVAEKCGE